MYAQQSGPNRGEFSGNSSRSIEGRNAPKVTRIGLYESVQSGL